MTAVHSGRPKAAASLWRHVDALIDRAPSDDDLRSHRLEVLAARRFRLVGRPVPEDFAARERLAAVALLTAPIVLERVRAAYDGPVIVIKGPEVAAHYPDPAMRGYGDLDLLVADAESLQRALLGAGFELVGEPELYVDIHHLRPVLASGMPLPVEVHSRPKWFGVKAPPRFEELLEAATPGASGVDGMLTLSREHHVLFLAVHSWAHEPLRRLRDIVDVAAMAEGANHPEIARLARAWGVERIWQTTAAATDVLFGDRATSSALRMWAGNLCASRDRTVLEHHLERLLSDFWAMPFSIALARIPRTVADELRPGSEEGWGTKLSRVSLALRNARRRRSDHRQERDERLSQLQRATAAKKDDERSVH